MGFTNGKVLTKIGNVGELRKLLGSTTIHKVKVKTTVVPKMFVKDNNILVECSKQSLLRATNDYEYWVSVDNVYTDGTDIIVLGGLV